MKKIIRIIILMLTYVIFFNINNVNAMEDDTKVFDGLEENFINIKITNSEDNTVVKEEKGLCVTDGNNIKYAIVDSSIINYVQGDNKDYVCQAVLKNGVCLNLEKEFASDKLDVVVMKINKDVKSDLKIKFMSGEENILESSILYKYSDSIWQKCGKVDKYYEKDNIRYMMINSQDSEVKLNKGEFLFSEEGICVGIVAGQENNALNIVELTNAFDSFGISYIGSSNAKKDELNKLIDEAKDIKLSNYTSSSAKKLSTAIKDGEKCAESESSTQKEVDKSVKNLTDAKKGLVKDEHIKDYFLIGMAVVIVILSIIIFVMARRKKQDKKKKITEREEKMKKIDEDLRKEEIIEDGIFEINDFKKVIKEENDIKSSNKED